MNKEISAASGLYRLRPAGDSAVTVECGEAGTEAVHLAVRRVCSLLEEHPFPGLIELVPAYTAVTVHYDAWAVYRETIRMAAGKEAVSSAGALRPAAPLLRRQEEDLGILPAPVEAVCHWLHERLQRLGTLPPGGEGADCRLVRLPVCYGGEYGPDLAFVALHTGLSEREVIRRHSEAEYKVYMIGFAPGFPYLGGLPPELSAPRRSQPRPEVPRGAVGIAGTQTGVYPQVTPGGWQIIGRTPLSLFQPDCDPPALLQAGDRIRFVPINPVEYAALSGQSGSSFGLLRDNIYGKGLLG
ncbi:5-oxoprolinase subunit PxpB [Paenibacillus sp. y28]|uniref:5-oxoprolinase subunit PxpB n=1 Tax=Paenibacillus sp. y28 TaxID=3129110 RepID=UPI0030171C59